MKDKEMQCEEIVGALRKIAFCRPNAAVELAFADKPSKQAIGRLDLSAVAEFRRNSAGSVEIKFIDRVKALEALYRMVGGGEDGGDAAEFFRALEEAGDQA